MDIICIFWSKTDTDKLVILFQVTYNHVVRECMQQAMNVIIRWTKEEGLNVSATKSTIVAKSINLEGASETLRGEVI